MDTETNFVICLGVRFALHVIKALRLARIGLASATSLSHSNAILVLNNLGVRS